MKFIKSARSAVCIAALVAGNAAFADVTAQDVWDNWKSQMDIYGENDVSIGSEDYSNGVLTVTDMSMVIADEESTVSATMANITFTENGDGTVAVTYSDEYPITIASNDKPAENRVTILFKSVGNLITVSGTPDEMNYEIKADRYTVSVTEAIEDGVAADMDAVFNINSVGGSYVVSETDLTRDMSYDLKAASLDMLFSFADDAESVDLSGQIATLAMAGSMSTPLEYDADAAPEDIFKNGMALKADYSTGTANYIINVTAPEGPTNITSSSSSATLSTDVSKDAASVGFNQSDVVLNLISTESPFPIDLTAKQFGMSIAMPMGKTDEPVDFSATLDLVDLNTNDMIWSMVDPSGALPHDPITAQLDLTGTGKLNYDLTDPEQAAAMESADVPGEINSLNLNALNLVVAGATVTGTGAFTFDNTDLETFEGMPRPEGTLDLQAKGVNGLLDKLQNMGLIPEDQMMGARMMLGMFATVVGDDQLTSKLEVNATGGVLLNGQQIR